MGCQRRLEWLVEPRSFGYAFLIGIYDLFIFYSSFLGCAWLALCKEPVSMMIAIFVISGLLICIAVPVFMVKTKDARRRLQTMYIGLYISGLSLVTTIVLTYLCLIEGVISFGTRTQSVTLLQSEAPVLYLLLAPFSIALPSCFILFDKKEDK